LFVKGDIRMGSVNLTSWLEEINNQSKEENPQKEDQDE